MTIITYKIAVITMLAVALAGSVSHGADATRLYVMGNSLTDQLRHDDFARLAEAGGQKVIWGRHTIPGSPACGLWGARDQHGFEKEPFGRWPKAFAEFKWDAVTIQPFGEFFENELPAIEALARELMKKSPAAQLLIYAQWPTRTQPQGMIATDATDWELRFAGKQKFYETPSWLGREGKPADPQYHYSRIVEQLAEPDRTNFRDRSLKHQYEAYVHALNAAKLTQKPVRLIPVGHVLQLLGQKMAAGLVPGYQNLWQLYPDDVHVNNVGSYIVALTFYATIFAKSPVGLPVGDYQFAPGMPATVPISPELAKIIQETVWEVVASHPLSGVTSDAKLAVATPALRPAIVNDSYRFELLPAFGRAPYSWSVSAGALPGGLDLSAAGVLQGKPTTSGRHPLTFAVRDAAGQTAQREFTWVVEENVPPVIPEQSLPVFAVGRFDEYRLKSVAGNGSHVWRVKKDHALPPGLNLDADGRFWGAPGKEGEFTFTLEVADGKIDRPDTAERAFTLRVQPPVGPVAFARRLTEKQAFETATEPQRWDFRYPIAKLVVGDKASVSGAFDLAWDETHLYIAVKITDPTLAKGAHWNKQLEGDSVVLCLDAFNNREATYNADDRFMVLPRGEQYLQRSLGVGSFWGIAARQQELTDGYLVVFQVAWRNLGLPEKMSPHWTVGLDLMLVDDAKDGVPSAIVVWQGTKNNATDPSKFGTVVLAE